jgi:molybdenum cofactor cytidylyltransferase
MHIVGILLAAGRGTRFGGDKLLAALPPSPGMPPGTSVGGAAARHLRAARPQSVAVGRPGADRAAAMLRVAGMRIVECVDADDGMGASLACGVAATPQADGWVVALADMPWIVATTIRAVAHALACGAAIVAPAYRGERGHPVGFARTHFAALTALRGDAGARSIIAAHPDALMLLEVGDAGVVRDVDTPAALCGRPDGPP